MNVDNFKIVDFFENQNKEFLELERGEDFVKIIKTKTDFPEKYKKDKIFLLESLFFPNTSPYPGVISKTIECSEKFLPEKIKEDENSTVYCLLAGERKNYGICAEDLFFYYSSYGIFDCGKKGMFEVQVFSKKENVPLFIINSFNCNL